MEVPMMLAQAVALSLAGEADARLKYSVTARQQRYRHHPTTKEQNDQCQTPKNIVLRAVHTMWNNSTSVNLKWALPDLVRNGNFSIQIMSF